MPIPGIIQPEIIQIEYALRLKAYEASCDFALSWYQDAEILYMVDGVTIPYSIEKLNRMYEYLNCLGEVYFIEVLENDNWLPIGDVTFCQKDMPIVIGNKAYHNKGIGKKVVSALVSRGKILGYRELFVKEIYDFNLPSQRLFESLGFQKAEKTETGYRYSLTL